MIKNSNYGLRSLAAVSLLMLLVAACQKDFSDLQLVGVNPDFETEVAYFNAHASNTRLSSVQTNGLSVYQLGRYTSTVFGTEEAYIVSQLQLSSTSPRFGTYSQATEVADDTLATTIDEEETVTRVYLDLPFFSTIAIDEDGTAILDDEDDNTYKLDSIYGNKTATFNLKVQQLTYYLGDFQEPDFTQSAKYYSSDPAVDFMNYTGVVLADTTGYTISSETIKHYPEDDPDTTDEDESTEADEVLTPRIRINLNKEFFQEKIINQEGSQIFASNTNFKEYLRGIVISTSNFSDDLLMLLDMSGAKITIEYNYQKYNADEETLRETVESSFDINVSGNIVQRISTPNFPTINTEPDSDNIYLKGTQGSMAEIALFDEGDIQTMKDENWLINEANLTFYVNRDALAGSGVIEPNRIYLFNLNDKSIPLIDYSYDGTTSTSNPYISKYIHGGIIEKNDDGDAIKYKIRLTEHLNDIVRHDSTSVRLGLVVLSNINNVISSSGVAINKTAKINGSDTEVLVPSTSITNPSGTVLYGSGTDVPEDKRLRLEVYYTKPSN